MNSNQGLIKTKSNLNQDGIILAKVEQCMEF